MITETSTIIVEISLLFLFAVGTGTARFRPRRSSTGSTRRKSFRHWHCSPTLRRLAMMDFAWDQFANRLLLRGVITDEPKCWKRERAASGQHKMRVFKACMQIRSTGLATGMVGREYIRQGGEAATLTVVVERARDLPRMDLWRGADAFCVVFVEGSSRCQEPRADTAAPCAYLLNVRQGKLESS
jgi:hypothetical protein